MSERDTLDVKDTLYKASSKQFSFLKRYLSLRPLINNDRTAAPTTRTEGTILIKWCEKHLFIKFFEKFTEHRDSLRNRSLESSGRDLSRVVSFKNSKCNFTVLNLKQSKYRSRDTQLD